MAGSARAVSASRFVVAGKGERAPLPQGWASPIRWGRASPSTVVNRDGSGDARRPLFNAALSWALSPGSPLEGEVIRLTVASGARLRARSPEQNLPCAEPRDLIHERGMAAIVTLASGGAF